MKNFEEKIDELTKKAVKKIDELCDRADKKENYEELIFKVKETLYSYWDKIVSLVEHVIREEISKNNSLERKNSD